MINALAMCDKTDVSLLSKSISYPWNTVHCGRIFKFFLKKSRILTTMTAKQTVSRKTHRNRRLFSLLPSVAALRPDMLTCDNIFGWRTIQLQIIQPLSKKSTPFHSSTQLKIKYGSTNLVGYLDFCTSCPAKVPSKKWKLGNSCMKP